MPLPLSECSNCFQRFEAQYPYCPYCGQKSQEKLTLGVLFNNTISNYFSVDARFFKSFVPLMTRPGYLAKRFVEGKRLTYLHPAQFYLFVSVVFFFLFSFIGRKQVEELDGGIKKAIENTERAMDSISQIQQDTLAMQQFRQPMIDQDDSVSKGKEMKPLDSVVKTHGLKKKNSIFNMNFNESRIDSMIENGVPDRVIYKEMGMNDNDGAFTKRFYSQALKLLKNKSGGTILQAFYDSIPIAMFILLPIFAFILKIFYFNKGRFAHHLVFSFYFFSFLFSVFGILTLTDLIWKELPWSIIILVMLSTFFYLFLGVKHFYGQGYFLSFVKSNVVTFIFLSIVMPFAVTIMGLVAFLFY